MNSRQVALWASYDFAITILEFTVAFYLSQWLVSDLGISELLYSGTIAVSLFFALLLLPILGLFSDQSGRRLPYLRFFSFIGALAVALIGYVGLAVDDHATVIWITLILFAIMNIAYQGSLMFYNSLLSHVASPEHIGTASGVGISFGYIGAILGGLIASAFASGQVPFLEISLSFIETPSRANAFLPAALLFALFSIPTLLFVRELKIKETIKERVKQIALRVKEVPGSYETVWGGLKHLGRYPAAIRFLFAYLFFNNAMGTIVLFAPIYMEHILGTPDNQKVMIVLSSLAMAVIGGISGGFLADHLGKKKVLSLILTAWIILLGIIVWVKIMWLFWALYALGGFLFGATWAVSRALFVSLIPLEEQGKFFSFYAISERFALIIGPFVWGSVVALLSGFGPVKYQFALAAMIVLIGIGFVILSRVRALEASDNEQKVF